MRRLIAAAACLGTVALLAPTFATPAHAKAHAADPVSALTKQFVTAAA